MKKTIIIIVVVTALIGITLTAFFTLNKKENTDTQNQSSEYLSVSSELEADQTEASSNIKTEESKPKENLPYLKITKPQTTSFTTESASVTFSGNTNITTGVTINGEQIKLARDIDGSFTVTKELNYGQNKFVFKAGKFTKTYNINRKYVIIKGFLPKTEQIYSAGSEFTVYVTAKKDAKVIAGFNGEKIALTKKWDKDDEFSVFSGVFTLPKGHFKDLNLGGVKFKATYKEYTDTAITKDIICQKEKTVITNDKDVTPTGGKYINVGSGVITEVVAFQAETFYGKGTNDTSKPFYNYLPKGTVDYGSTEYVTASSTGEKLQLITLRCGKKVYKYRYDKPPKTKVAVTKQYVGTLPDHNELSVSGFYETATHTRLILDTLWKAPFNFELKNQEYNSDYSISSITYKHIDITFCYSTKFEGEINIPKDHPLFTKATLIKNKSDCTLRLYLKKQGGFYGWDAYYNSNNQLCFEFLKPVKIKTANNKYGADLSGARILIDVGHGGIDSGAANLGGRANCEAVRNLVLAKKLARELKSIGATVYLTRTYNATSSADAKCEMLKNLKPDYCIAIHHDSNNSSSLNGFGSYYYYPYSKNAAEYVLNHTYNTGIYKNKNFKWHYYFVSRVSVCPVVLTENGYMSNKYDYYHISNDASNTKKAEALTRGIVEYFVSIQ